MSPTYTPPVGPTARDLWESRSKAPATGLPSSTSTPAWHSSPARHTSPFVALFTSPPNASTNSPLGVNFSTRSLRPSSTYTSPCETPSEPSTATPSTEKDANWPAPAPSRPARQVVVGGEASGPHV